MNESKELTDSTNSHNKTKCMICLEAIDIYIITNKCNCKLPPHTEEEHLDTNHYIHKCPEHRKYDKEFFEKIKEFYQKF